MKPLLLRMQAFGPYQSVEEVDFTKFNQGLFLITGPTGSGKSTIFDALCFALYNEASGEYKESKMFRSDFATDDLETWVSLEFSHQGKHYHVYRKPSYLRKKKKSNDTTMAQGEATLSIDGQLIYTGLNEVTRAVEDLLKVKASQFKQIVMIAQGEFLKLLLTKSDERMNIYRRLFNTQVYAEFSSRLKEEFLKIDASYQNLKEEFDKIKQELDLDETAATLTQYVEQLTQTLQVLYRQKDEHVERFQELQKRQSSVEKMLSQAEETVKLVEQVNHIKQVGIALSEMKPDYDLKREKLKGLDYVLREIKPLVDQTDEIRKEYEHTQKQLLTLKETIIKYERALEVSRAELVKLSDQSTLIEQEKVVIHSLSEQLKQYDQYEKNKDTLTKNEMDLVLLLKKKEQLTEQCANVVQQIDHQRAFILKHSNVQQKMELCINELNKLADEKRKYEIISDLSNKKLQAQADLTQAMSRYETSLKSYEDYAFHFYASQAGLLAEKLTDHEACPVCGSLSHPHKAKLTGEKVSKVVLDELATKKSNAQELLQSESTTITTLEHDIDHYQETLAYAEEVLFAAALEEQELLKISYEEQWQQLNQTIRNQEIDEGRLKHIQIEQSQNDQSVKAKENECLVLKTMLTNASVSFTYQSQSETQLVLKQAQAIVTSFEEKKQGIEKIINENVVQLAKCRGEYASLNPLGERYFSKLSQLEAEIATRMPDSSNYQLLLNETSTIATLKQAIESYDQQVAEMSTKQGQLEVLVSGRTSYDCDELKDEIGKLIELIKELEEEKEAMNLDIELKDRYLKRLVNLASRQGDLEIRYALYKPLSDTANANISKKARISFEIFVQGMYFMEVLAAANIRLHKMTLARFTLKMRDTTGLQSVSGLDIEVFDEYTAKSRDVKTLSGGESFMASLSLALGLSDVIAQKAAGIELECIFIDEGFGTLDTQTLEQALSLLQELVTQNRMVGIISHVDTLKQRIEQKIEISKEYKGSTLHQVL